MSIDPTRCDMHAKRLIDVPEQRPRSKANAAFTLGLLSRMLGGAPFDSLFVPAVRLSLPWLAEVIHPNAYADLQRELGTLDEQYRYYLNDTNNPVAAMQCVGWNWLRDMDHALPAAHPYRKWYALGLASAGTLQQWRDRPADLPDLTVLLQAISQLDDDDLGNVAVLKEIAGLDLSGQVLESLLAGRYSVTDPKELGLKFISEVSEDLDAISDVPTSEDEIRRARKGKPGRRPKREALARFAVARRNRKPPMIWADIAVEWEFNHPDDRVTGEIVRNAVKNHKAGKKRWRA